MDIFSHNIKLKLTGLMLATVLLIGFCSPRVPRVPPDCPPAVICRVGGFE